MSTLAKPDIDLDSEAINQLAQRRVSQPLLIGYLVAVATVFELMGWLELADPPVGTRQWQPPGASSEGVYATLRHESGGAVDLYAGAMSERHLSICRCTGAFRRWLFSDTARLQRPLSKAAIWRRAL